IRGGRPPVVSPETFHVDPATVPIVRSTQSAAIDTRALASNPPLLCANAVPGSRPPLLHRPAPGNVPVAAIPPSSAPNVSARTIPPIAAPGRPDRTIDSPTPTRINGQRVQAFRASSSPTRPWRTAIITAPTVIRKKPNP